MQPEFLSIPNSLTAFAGVAGLLAVVTIIYYGFSRNNRYEKLIRQQKIDKEIKSMDQLPVDS